MFKKRPNFATTKLTKTKIIYEKFNNTKLHYHHFFLFYIHYPLFPLIIGAVIVAADVAKILAR